MKQKGFTLLELLLVAAVIALLSGLAAPIYYQVKVKNDLSIAAQQAHISLRRAQQLAQNMEGDSPWGVRIQPPVIRLFKGANYASRDTSFDEDTSMATGIGASGLTEVIFNKLTGIPTTTGTLTLSLSSGEVRNLIINAKGAIE